MKALLYTGSKEDSYLLYRYMYMRVYKQMNTCVYMHIHINIYIYTRTRTLLLTYVSGILGVAFDTEIINACDAPAGSGPGDN